MKRASEGESFEERCHVVCARLGRKATAREANAIGDILDAADANGWWFLSPGTAIAVFVSRKDGAGRAMDCAAALRQLAGSGLETAVAEGSVTATFTAEGLIRSMPVGEVVAEAVRMAMR